MGEDLIKATEPFSRTLEWWELDSVNPRIPTSFRVVTYYNLPRSIACVLYLFDPVMTLRLTFGIWHICRVYVQFPTRLFPGDLCIYSYGPKYQL
jgi:hypothetical protein